jgi:hypothetical protein
VASQRQLAPARSYDSELACQGREGEKRGSRKNGGRSPSFDGLRQDFEGLRKKNLEKGDLVELVFLVLISFIVRYRERR